MTRTRAARHLRRIAFGNSLAVISHFCAEISYFFVVVTICRFCFLFFCFSFFFIIASRLQPGSRSFRVHIRFVVDLILYKRRASRPPIVPLPLKAGEKVFSFAFWVFVFFILCSFPSTEECIEFVGFYDLHNIFSVSLSTQWTMNEANLYISCSNDVYSSTLGLYASFANFGKKYCKSIDWRGLTLVRSHFGGDGMRSDVGFSHWIELTAELYLLTFFAPRMPQRSTRRQSQIAEFQSKKIWFLTTRARVQRTHRRKKRNEIRMIHHCRMHMPFVTFISSFLYFPISFFFIDIFSHFILMDDVKNCLYFDFGHVPLLYGLRYSIIVNLYSCPGASIPW